MVTELCGCALASVHIEKPVGFTGPFCFNDYCNGSQIYEQAKCVKRFFRIRSVNDCSECMKPACVQWNYKDHISTFYTSDDMTAPEFAEDFLDSSHPSIEDMRGIYGNLSNVPNTFISKNYAKFTVTFSDVHVRSRQAVKSVTGFSLFSSLGGAFSFWIGFSIMTFIEVIEWLVMMLVRLRPIKTQNSNVKDNDK